MTKISWQGKCPLRDIPTTCYYCRHHVQYYGTRRRLAGYKCSCELHGHEWKRAEGFTLCHSSTYHHPHCDDYEFSRELR